MLKGEINQPKDNTCNFDTAVTIARATTSITITCNVKNINNFKKYMNI